MVLLEKSLRGVPPEPNMAMNKFIATQIAFHLNVHNF